ncbi:unnamed protein product [Adineta ricciae]|uniref:RING-type domain-containing protein n=1 Tax=Adineta ricciae TaxID=249248 RepID=A0A814M8E0_ADIRI|nr:unnamed protein product [Adineta ricciae]CAF1247292.1 unnamed protein product [Adineta ricciae]
MPLFTRERVSCQAKPSESHLYNDPVMLICSHVFCRSCCLDLARRNQDHCIICPICSMRIPFDNLNRFATGLIAHGTLATMVKQYLREEQAQRICVSCGKNHVNNVRSRICEKCEIEQESIKRKIVETVKKCDKLISNQKMISLDKIYGDMNEIYTLIDQRTANFNQTIENYEKKLNDLLTKQQKANELNALKHQPIDIESVSELVEPRLNALKKNKNLLENLDVEKEIKRLSDEADRKLRLLKHKADIVPVLRPPSMKPSNHMFGELLFKSTDDETKSSKLTPDQSMVNTSGDTSLQSIPPKLPMWTVNVNTLPSHLCVHSVGKSTLIFSCSSSGIISLFNYISPVTYDSPRYIRTFHLFPAQVRIHVQSFAVFSHFMLVHIRDNDRQDAIYFFSHDGNFEYGPIYLLNLVRHFLADENRLWAIDSVTQTIFFHVQPLSSHEISSLFSRHDQFVTFDKESNFIPLRLAINQQLLAVLSKDFHQVYIYNKISRERIFVSHFTVGNSTNIWDIGLFPRDNSLLLKFDCMFEGNVKRSLFIHFNTKNQSVGRIEGKHCLSVVIGPNKEVLIGFNLRTGIIRCYM